jgi:hypothetical protein
MMGYLKLREDRPATIDEHRALRAIEKAARAYYLGYCQDEADEEGICDLRQQMAARDLRDALAAYGQGGEK